MLISSLVAVLLLSVGSQAAGDVITPKDTIPQSSPSGPSMTDLNKLYPGEIYPWDYPDASKLKPWPMQPPGSKRDECSLTLHVSVGRCASGAYGYKPQIIPYDDASTTDIAGNVKFVVNHDGDFIDYTTVTLGCYWRGRVMPTDSPEVQRRIGLASVRIDTSPDGMRAWVTDEPEDETGMKQTQIAPIGFVEFGGHKPYNRKYSSARGFDKTVQKSSVKHETLYIQVC